MREFNFTCPCHIGGVGEEVHSIFPVVLQRSAQLARICASDEGLRPATTDMTDPSLLLKVSNTAF